MGNWRERLIGNSGLVLTGSRGLPRSALLAELAKIAKGGGVTTYVVRLLDDGSIPGGDTDDLAGMFTFLGGSHGPPPVRPRRAARRRGCPRAR